ncbi:MAG TPA: hypothetical protein VJ377_07050 [Dehalococcoidales bacterium]|nr:hypothetical protein [Dehalococcoidales bacterium]
MAKTKYGKYFLTQPEPGAPKKGFWANDNTVAYTDDDVIKGSELFWAVRMGPAWIAPPHGPHTHQDPEVLVMLGTDPDDPWDLGAEIELCMGPEMEKHVITRSTLVYIPANFLHCPIAYRNVRRPFIFIQSQYAPKLTETSFKKLVAERERDKMVFFDLDGQQTEIELRKQREGNYDRIFKTD